MDDHTKEIEKSKNKMAILFGLVAGLVYTLCLWGIDAVKLASANAYYPWAKLFIGILPVVGICILAAWLSNRSGNSLLSLLIWMVTGFLICNFASYLSIKGIEFFYRLADASLADRVSYVLYPSLNARIIIACIISTLLAAISGVFFAYLLESANSSAALAGVVFAMLLWSLFSAGSAAAVNVMIDVPLRSPVDAVDRLIEKKILDEATPYSKEEARELHLSSLNTVEDLLHQPRKLIMTNYDAALTQTSVQINFNGTWAECIVIADQSSEPPVQHPIYCKIIE